MVIGYFCGLLDRRRGRRVRRTTVGSQAGASRRRHDLGAPAVPRQAGAGTVGGRGVPAAAAVGQRLLSARRGDGVAVSDGGRKSEQTRERILAAARNAFARKGFSGVTIKDITEPADVTRANFYYYYADKTQLFIELGTATYLEVLAVVESFGDIATPATRT